MSIHYEHDGRSYTGAPPLSSSLRQHTDWVDDPWAAPEVTEARRKERHARWIAALTARDWERISRMVDQVVPGASPAAIPDLDAPIRVGACAPADVNRFTGERFGTLRGQALLAFPKLR